MRTNYFLFPKMNIQSGGHIAQIKIYESIRSLRPATYPVTYDENTESVLFLDTLLKDHSAQDAIFFIHWGPHIPRLINRLRSKAVVYVAHSTGYNFCPPVNVPILCVSRHTQAYWGRNAPASSIYYLPDIISAEYTNRHVQRPIDILIQKRKSSDYLLNQLVPALQAQCSVRMLDNWVDDLAGVFNQSKVYLYDSVDHWVQRGFSEGFGLPPLEALACGCTVFSTVNDALSDYLDPGMNSHKLRIYSTKYDLQRILSAVHSWQDMPGQVDPVHFYRQENVKKRAEIILQELDAFFDFSLRHPATIHNPLSLPTKGTGKTPSLIAHELRSYMKKISPLPIKSGLKYLLGKPNKDPSE